MRLLVAAAIAAVACVAFAPPQHHKSNLKTLRRQHAANRSKRRKLAAQVHRVQQQAHKVRSDIGAIDNDISSLADKLAFTQSRLKSNLAQQKVLLKELDKATADLSRRSEQARLRLREIAMHGGATLASAIVGAKSMADLSARRFVFERIAQRDRDLFDEVRKLRKAVMDEEQQKERLIAQIQQDIEDEQTEKNQLTDVREEKLGALQNLKSQEGQLEQLLHELDQEDAQLESSIAQFEAGPGRAIPAYHGRFGPPVYGGRLSSPFGMRFHPILHRMRMHTGQDFAAPYGTPIHAAGDGVVVTCAYLRGYGNAIVVDHGGGIATLYGHCSRILARPGQHVRRGDEIALVGATGLATGPHCHFEVRINGKPVNPMRYLR